MYQQLIAFLFVLILGVPAHADTSWLTDNPVVLEEAKALTKKTKRDLIVYHWTSRSVFSQIKEPLDITKTSHYMSVQSNILDRTMRFWDLTLSVSGRSASGGAMAPNGLYVATNPVISRNYGGDDWFLYQVVIPKGTIFIDGRYRQSPIIGKNLEHALAERGCINPIPVSDQTPVFTARNLIKADTHQTACREALADIALETEATAILYIFTEEKLPICKEVNKWNAAFVVIHPDAIQQSKSLFYTKEVINDGLEQERMMLNTLFENASMPLLYPELSTVDETSMKDFVKQNYMSCDPAIREW